MKMCEEKGGKRKRDSWFRKNNITSIIRIPYTRGELKENINKILMQPDSAPLGTKTVAQEESGTKLKDVLIKSDPFPMLTCNREECHTVVGKNGEIGQCSNTCWQQHVNYTVTCKICEEESIKESDRKNYIYIGETSRGCYTRFNQEKNECIHQSKGFMYKHIMEKHEGNIRNEFKIKRHRIDKDPIRRIIRESVRIERAVKDNSIIVMNSKDEHFGVQTVRGSFNSEWFED